MTLSEQTAACSGASPSFAPELTQDAQVCPKLAALSPVPSNVAVNGFLAHHGFARQMSAADNLSGAPKASQRTSDGAPISKAIAFIPAAAPSPGDGILVGLLGSVSAVVSGSVAPQFTTDGGRRSVQYKGDKAHAVMLAEKPADDVSFLLGELAVSHVSNPFLPDEEADRFAGSPLSLDRGVALSLANRVA